MKHWRAEEASFYSLEKEKDLVRQPTIPAKVSDNNDQQQRTTKSKSKDALRRTYRGSRFGFHLAVLVLDEKAGCKLVSFVVAIEIKCEQQSEE